MPWKIAKTIPPTDLIFSVETLFETDLYGIDIIRSSFKILLSLKHALFMKFKHNFKNNKLLKKKKACIAFRNWA